MTGSGLAAAAARRSEAKPEISGIIAAPMNPPDIHTTTSSLPQRRRNPWAVATLRLAYRFQRNWFAIFLILTGAFVVGPWTAPALTNAGWTGAGKAVYTGYSFFCHQLPQRSFFLFGPSPSQSLAEVRSIWSDTNDPSILRQFVGNPQVGYKVAWSDRMVSMYTSIPLAALLWRPFRRRLRPLPLWAFALLILPITVDGLSHMVSDLAGIGEGFRDTNVWLAALTGRSFPSSFYAGDALGSFNSWMRLITGVLFGIGLVGLALPHLHSSFADTAEQIENKFSRAELPL